MLLLVNFIIGREVPASVKDTLTAKEPELCLTVSGVVNGAGGRTVPVRDVIVEIADGTSSGRHKGEIVAIVKVPHTDERGKALDTIAMEARLAILALFDTPQPKLNLYFELNNAVGSSSYQTAV